MPPKDYDLLRPVYGSSVYGAIPKVPPAYRYDPVDITVSAINIVIGNLDQYTENEILETIPRIEKAICGLPIDESLKSRLCDMLWDPNVPVSTSLHTITTLLSKIQIVN